MIELKDTAALMCSEDYKERFLAEYAQVAIRYKKLYEMCEKWDMGKLEFKPTCPRDFYTRQLNAMADYIVVLQDRAKLEGIDLDKFYVLSMEPLTEIQKIKSLRREGDFIVQAVKGGLPSSRETSLAITKFQEGIMWLGMELKRRHEANPYPSSKDPSTGDIIEDTADNLKL